MRPIDVRHLGRENVICAWVVDDIVVDPGPQSTEATLLEALGDLVPRALLLTHIHFDHAGATGSLLRRWPDVPVYVHEKGARHLVDPEKLVASAGRLYGGDEGLRRLWGEVVPVPEGNLRVLTGGERDIEGAFRVAYTPGHASHHVSYLHEPSGWAFVGDTAGVKMPPSSFTVAPTPPPDIDVEAWDSSLDAIAAWEPTTLAFTHFGQAGDAAAQLERCREALHAEAELAAQHDQDGFVAAMAARIREGVGELAESMEQAAPPDQLFLGLDRWRRKRAEAAA
jgi:glyoxylase-like metal-dependent hydrolase (beta-lactamase superfamily II)